MKTVLSLVATVLMGATVSSQIPSYQPKFDPELARRSIRRDAEAAMASLSDTALKPVPLSASSAQYGYIFDRFLASRADAVRLRAENKLTIDAMLDPTARHTPMTLVVAFPLVCEGRTVHPTAIDVSIQLGTSPGPVNIGPKITDANVIRSLAGGFDVPEGAVAQGANSVALGAAAVRIVYDGPECGSSRDTVTFRFARTYAASSERSTSTVVKLPAGSTVPWPVTVYLSGWSDTSGVVRGEMFTHGPRDVEAAALTALAGIRVPVTSVNGTPTWDQAQIALTFVGEGAPTLPVPSNPGSALQPSMSFTQNGAIPFRSTYNAVGLTTANSPCPVAADTTYALTPDAPARVGGGNVNGPARERTYMDTLRGGSGQATRYRRLGSAQNKAGVILDIYEVQFDGLTKPVLVYVDEYTFEELKAPFGMACVQPFSIK